MDDLHLEADLFFGPCTDPDCPAAALAARERRLELVCPTREQRQVDGTGQWSSYPGKRPLLLVDDVQVGKCLDDIHRLHGHGDDAGE